MIDPKTFKLKFEFTIEETNTLLQGLQELPAKVCNPLTQVIQQQASVQLPQDAEEDSKKK